MTRRGARPRPPLAGGETWTRTLDQADWLCQCTLTGCHGDHPCAQCADPDDPHTPVDLHAVALAGPTGPLTALCDHCHRLWLTRQATERAQATAANILTLF